MTPADPTRPPVAAPGAPEQDDLTVILPTGAARVPDEDERTRIAGGERADPCARPVQPGVLINNNYRIQQMISQGGMGEVYRAENVFTGDPVALKIVLPGLARDAGIVQLFMREARILGALNDDAIVRYHNFIFDQSLGRYCLIMEYIDGTTLWDHVDVHGPIGAPAALRLMARLAEGLAKAHARGVTHRDLSPDNVMLRGDDMAQSVLIDFGIARAADMGEGALDTRFAGKFKYIAPEQLGHFGGEVGPAADIYGMALMIAAVMRGRPLDMGGSAERASAARQAIPDLGDIPHEIYPLLQYMLEPDPAARPSSMADVAAMARDPMRIPLRYRHPLWTSPDGTLPPTAAGWTVPLQQTGPAGASPAPAEDVAASLPAARRSAGRIAALVAAAAVLAGTGVLWLASRAPDAPPPASLPEAAATAPALPAPDPATPAGFLAGVAMPPCTLLKPVVAGLDAGKLVLLTDGPRDLSAALAGYEAAFGERPAIVAADIATAQCPALDLLRGIQGRGGPAPVVSLDSDRLGSGGMLAGRVRETRGRAVWLVLIGPDGAVHDLSSRLVPQADGSFLFSFGMSRAEPGVARQLIVALASADPLVAAAAAPDGAPAATLMPRMMDEIAAAGGQAAADAVWFDLLPAGSDG